MQLAAAQEAHARDLHAAQQAHLSDAVETARLENQEKWASAAQQLFPSAYKKANAPLRLDDKAEGKRPMTRI